MYFRTLWFKVKYGCRESNGSLKVVPPGMTRESLGYCDVCTAARCLFAKGNGNGHDRERKRAKAGFSRRVAQSRARGLNTRGQPLTPSCWNCAHIRVKLGGYVCQFEPEEAPVGKATMSRFRRVEDTGCQAFSMRLTVGIEMAVEV